MTNTHTTLAGLFQAIANAIRGKTGGTEQIVADYFPEAIAAIETGADTSDATATASDLLAGRTAYAQGGKVTGTIPVRAASDITASGATVTIPAGYYAAQGSKSVATAEQATPSITVSASGLITATAAQSAGYVAAGSKSGTLQMTTQAAQTITPGTSAQTIPSGRYLTGPQTISGDSDLKAANIKSGVSIFGVSGSYTGTAHSFTTVRVAVTNSSGYGATIVYCGLAEGFSGSSTTAPGVYKTVLSSGSSVNLYLCVADQVLTETWLTFASPSAAYDEKYLRPTATSTAFPDGWSANSPVSDWGLYCGKFVATSSCAVTLTASS